MAFLSIEDALTGELDVEEKVASIPDSLQVKGMFFSRLRDRVGSGFAELEPQLVKPPRRGHYVAFIDYPQRDYMRVAAAAAQRMYPTVSLREALRRLARTDFEVFSGSRVGKVVLATVGDAHTALLTVPRVYPKMAPGDYRMEGTDLDPETVRIEMNPTYGAWEYVLGQLEGLVMHFGAAPRTEVSLPGEGVRFDVRHG
ncbi:MAG: DUF2378 family protein [Myxococcota bacterium]